MDWKLLTGTFITVFVAELGDKTQFVTLAASSQTKSWLEIWIAVVLALAAAGTCGVVAGQVLAKYLDPRVLKYASGAMFVVLGVWILLRPVGTH